MPLSGVRVLDVSTVLAAPVTATFLGDFGAEVVKIEDPGRGDFTRGAGAGRSPAWLQEGRNKRSVTLDLRTSAGRDLLRRMVPHFDVVVVNYRPPTQEKWGITPEELRALNPRAVIASITGYGLTGPYRDRGAFDRTASAFSGLTYVSGEPDRPPVRSGYSVIDYMSAYLAAFGVVTALYHRDVRGGEGQVIDLALYEAGFRAAEDSLTSYALTGRVRERLGNRNPAIVPATDFDTADGRRITLHAGTQPIFLRLAALMGLEVSERFATWEARVAHQDELYALIAEWVAGLGADEVCAVLNAAGIPSAPIMNVADVMRDPHYQARQSFVSVQDEEFGQVPMAAPLPRMSLTPGSIRSTGPALGAHTDEVLGELLGLTKAELDALRDEGAI